MTSPPRYALYIRRYYARFMTSRRIVARYKTPEGMLKRARKMVADSDITSGVGGQRDYALELYDGETRVLEVDRTGRDHGEWA